MTTAAEPNITNTDQAHAQPTQVPQVPQAQVNQAAQAQAGGGRLDDLAQIIAAYNSVTEKLQHSHESLQNEVARLREELASTNAQLQRSKRLSALGEMAAGIAHEVRNPLAAIQLYAGMIVEDLAAKPPAIEPAHTNASRIANAVRDLNAVVNDVLSFARELKPEQSTIEVYHLLTDAIEAHRPAIDEADIEIELDLPTDLPAVIGDHGLLRQALLNLVRNSVEAMASRDEPRRLLLGARSEQGVVIVRVADTGPGIDPDHVERIFNPFFTTRNTGTGLGLAIVHRIADVHGGSIAVHNDGGAVFELHLPTNRQHMPDDRDDQRENTRAAAAGTMAA